MVDSGKWRDAHQASTLTCAEVLRNFIGATINYQLTHNQLKNMFPFEKLDVWHKAIDFADTVYRLTRSFPDEERFGLTSQMRRAAVSIASNIAEGSARFSRADFAHFIEIATGSVFEVVTQATVGSRQGFLSEADYAALYAAAETQGKMLSGLRRSVIDGTSV